MQKPAAIETHFLQACRWMSLQNLFIVVLQPDAALITLAGVSCLFSPYSHCFQRPERSKRPQLREASCPVQEPFHLISPMEWMDETSDHSLIWGLTKQAFSEALVGLVFLLFWQRVWYYGVVFCKSAWCVSKGKVLISILTSRLRTRQERIYMLKTNMWFCCANKTWVGCPHVQSMFAWVQSLATDLYWKLFWTNSATDIYTLIPLPE